MAIEGEVVGNRGQLPSDRPLERRAEPEPLLAAIQDLRTHMDAALRRDPNRRARTWRRIRLALAHTEDSHNGEVA